MTCNTIESPRRSGIVWLAGTVLLAAAGAVGRLAAVPPLLPDLDATNFARALARFSLAEQAPHFPGYPLYVLLARLAHAAGAGEVLALSLPGALGGGLAVAALAWSLRPLAGRAGALAAAALVALSPTAVVLGGAPGSDGVGFAALVVAAALALRAEELSGIPFRTALQQRSPSGEANKRRPFLARSAVRQSGPRLRGADCWTRLEAGVPGTACLAGLAVAAALGLRPSLFPALAGLAFVVPAGSRRTFIAAAGLFVAAWALPLVVLEGPARLGALATAFVAGHVASWGGTVATDPDPGGRFVELGAAVAGAAGLRAAVPAALVLGATACAGFSALAAFASRRARPPARPIGGAPEAATVRLLRAALWVGVPCAAWTLLGQNLGKPRHALPLLLPLALLLAALVARAPARLRQLLPIPVAAGLLLACVPAATAAGERGSAGARLVAHVAGELPPTGTAVFTGAEAALFARYAPHLRAARAGSPEALERETARLAAAGVHVYVTSAAPGVARLSGSLEPIARFDPEGPAAPPAGLALYRYLGAPDARAPREAMP